jgi:integrase
MSRVKVLDLAGRKYLVLRWVDPVTGAERQQSAKTTNKRKADRTAAELQLKLDRGDYNDGEMTWKQFRDRYWEEHLPSLAETTQGTANTAFNHLERLINPRRLSDVTPAMLSQFQAKMRAEGGRETTIAGVLGHLRASLGWAEHVGLIGRAPKIKMPRRARGTSGKMRGRPISGEEFERMLAKVATVRPHDAEQWKFYLTGLWLSGLRLSESLLFSWDDDAPLSVDFSGRRPRLKIWCEGEKGHRDRLLPMTPDFAAFLDRVAHEQRTGLVFKLDGHFTKKQMGSKRVSEAVSKIGKAAGVVTNKSEGKHGTCHDLRRSFGTRWASRVKPATLQLLMRHQNIVTTMRYYVALDADEIGDDLWKAWAQAGDDLGDICKGAEPVDSLDTESEVSNS